VIGIDLVNVAEFERQARTAGPKLLERLFCPGELTGDDRPEHLAGILAAKEAVIKACGLEAGAWREIGLRWTPAGRPWAQIRGRAEVIEVSIAHHGDYAVAVALAAGGADDGAAASRPEAQS